MYVHMYTNCPLLSFATPPAKVARAWSHIKQADVIAGNCSAAATAAAQ